MNTFQMSEYVLAVEWHPLCVLLSGAFYKMLLWCLQQGQMPVDMLLCYLSFKNLGCKNKTGGMKIDILYLILALIFDTERRACFEEYTIFISLLLSIKPNDSSRFWNRHAALAQQSRSKDSDFCSGCKSRLVVLNKQILVPTQLSWCGIIGCRLGWCG